MNRPLLASIFLFSPFLRASAQTLPEYIHIRKTYGIVESVNVAALETLFGSRVVEVQGIVKGSFRVGEDATLLLEKTDGDTMAIDAKKVPSWLVGNEVPARLIIQATRSEVNGPIHATLIAAATEEDMRPIEAAEIAKAEKLANASHKGKVYASGHGKGSKYKPDVSGPARTWKLPASKATPYYTAFIRKENPKLSYREANRIAEGVIGFSIRYGVDACLIMAMVICESDFNPTEVSHSGAMGLGQLMPETAADYGIKNPFDTIENLYGTVREIRSHMDKYRNETGDEFQSLVLGLAAYNAGEGAVRRHGGVPPYKETQAYVRKVIKLYYHLRGRG